MGDDAGVAEPSEATTTSDPTAEAPPFTPADPLEAEVLHDLVESDVASAQETGPEDSGDHDIEEEVVQPSRAPKPSSSTGSFLPKWLLDSRAQLEVGSHVPLHGIPCLLVEGRTEPLQPHRQQEPPGLLILTSACAWLVISDRIWMPRRRLWTTRSRGSRVTSTSWASCWTRPSTRLPSKWGGKLVSRLLLLEVSLAMVTLNPHHCSSLQLIRVGTRPTGATGPRGHLSRDEAHALAPPRRQSRPPNQPCSWSTSPGRSWARSSSSTRTWCPSSSSQRAPNPSTTSSCRYHARRIRDPGLR